MDMNLRNGKDDNDSVDISSNESKDELEQEEEERETVSLLAGSLKNNGNDNKKPKRKVQWKDRHGNKLVQVLEFYPSDSSDSEDEEESGGCCNCSIM